MCLECGARRPVLGETDKSELHPFATLLYVNGVSLFINVQCIHKFIHNSLEVQNPTMNIVCGWFMLNGFLMEQELFEWSSFRADRSCANLSSTYQHVWGFFSCTVQPWSMICRHGRIGEWNRRVCAKHLNWYKSTVVEASWYIYIYYIYIIKSSSVDSIWNTITQFFQLVVSDFANLFALIRRWLLFSWSTL